MESAIWMYHAEHGARLFQSADELDAAGDGWTDTPAAFAPGAIETKTYADGVTATGPAPLPEQSPADPQPLGRDALKARATELGIEYPRNITTEKLAELVAAHA